MIECTSLQGEAWSLLTCTYVFKVQGQTRHKSEQDDELRTICSSTYIGRLEVEKRKALCGVDVSASVESRIPLLHVQLRWRCCCLPAEHTECPHRLPQNRELLRMLALACCLSREELSDVSHAAGHSRNTPQRQRKLL
jgi:hypothetical protein